MIRFISAAALALFATTASAKPTVYYCQLDGVGNDGYMQPELVIGVDPEKDKVVVSDPFIMYAQQKPSEAEIVETSDKKTTYKWEVKFRNSHGQYARLRYRGSLFANGKIVVQMKPLGFANQYNGRGRCQISNVKIPGIN